MKGSEWNIEQRRQERNSVEFMRYIKQISYLCDVLVDALDGEATGNERGWCMPVPFPSP